MQGMDVVVEALRSATVTSFYNVMVREVECAQTERMEGLQKKLAKSEAEKSDIQESTTKVIQQLTMLNVQREGEFSNIQDSLKDQIQSKQDELQETEDANVNRSFSFAFKGGKSKSKKLKKEIEKLEDDIEEMKTGMLKLQTENGSLKKKERRLVRHPH